MLIKENCWMKADGTLKQGTEEHLIKGLCTKPRFKRKQSMEQNPAASNGRQR